MMGPYGKGAGKSGLICFANVVSLDFVKLKHLGCHEKTKHLKSSTWKNYFEVFQHFTFSAFEMICIKL